MEGLEDTGELQPLPEEPSSKETPRCQAAPGPRNLLAEAGDYLQVEHLSLGGVSRLGKHLGTQQAGLGRQVRAEGRAAGSASNSDD